MSSPSDRLTADMASRLARIALGHVAREYPNKMDHVLDGPADVRGPRDLHPIYFGSFDWHSCVHGYWTLATLLRLFPDVPEAGAIRDQFASAFTAENVAIETAYLARGSSRGFERPYGWAWLLKLQAELLAHDAPWATAHRPLADGFAQRFRDFLPLAAYPIRTGVHSSTAFALTLAADYADATGDHGLFDLFRTRAEGWYGQDQGAQAWEPSLDDFLSPTLMEAACMARLAGPDSFASWFERFLPDIPKGRPETLFVPVTPTDRSDGKIAHLDGLNLSRAWCWRSIARALPGAHPAQDMMSRTGLDHLNAALPHVSGDYMGEHWLASFAILALTA